MQTVSVRKVMGMDEAVVDFAVTSGTTTVTATAAATSVMKVDTLQATHTDKGVAATPAATLATVEEVATVADDISA